jgi:radical SAM enzyme (TIGR04100 family)
VTQLKHKGNRFTYIVGNGIYINLTNRCTNRCTFCIRNNGDGAYGVDTLWLEHEPSAVEVLEDLKQYDMSRYDEIVFCGYGEPTIRLDTLLEVAKGIKEAYGKPVRINTNGHANLIHGKNVAPLFAGLIDTVSISLNTPSAEEYEKLCLPVYGQKAFEALIAFAKDCVPYVKNVIFSVVRQTLSEEELQTCREIAEKSGVRLRIRELV